MEYDIEKIIRNVNLDVHLPLKQKLHFYKISFYISVLCFFVIFVIFLAIWIPERKKYRKKLKAATASSISTKNESIYHNNSSLGIPSNTLNGHTLQWAENNSKMYADEQCEERNSKISSSDIWNNISNPSLYSHNNNNHNSINNGNPNVRQNPSLNDNYCIIDQISPSEQQLRNNKNDKILKLINDDFAKIQQKQLDEALRLKL
ncbi:putative uncharacterized protein DDB_G0283051 [Gordionus sp. m RMFG-2023]|uniref:putative uncharacterized protein DDB_G0283051 n=1 Tax=Gordionus sp. m RMFG-2023 TaxID=3053472 RepID=UPI0031FD830F